MYPKVLINDVVVCVVVYRILSTILTDWITDHTNRIKEYDMYSIQSIHGIFNSVAFSTFENVSV